MKLKSLQLNNFKSFGKIDLDFEKLSDSVLIIGDNRDTIGADSNESGKSSLLDSIPWILMGEVPQKVLSDSIIRRDTNICDGRLQLEDDKHIYEIFRRRGQSGTKLEFYIDENEEHLRKTADTQKKILETFGLSPTTSIAFNDFFNCIYFSPGVVDAFASHAMTSSKRLELISRFLKLGKFDVAVDRIKENLKEFEKKSADAVSRKEFLVYRIEAVDETELKYQQSNLIVKRTALSIEKKDLQQLQDKGAELRQLSLKLESLYEKRKTKVDASEEVRRHLREDYTETNKKLKQYRIDEKELKELTIAVAELYEQVIERDRAFAKLSEVESEWMALSIQINEYIEQADNAGIADGQCPACGTDLLIDDGCIGLFDSEAVAERKFKEEAILIKLQTKEKLLAKRKQKLEKEVNGRKTKDAYDELVIDKETLKRRLAEKSIDELEKELREVDKKGLEKKQRLEQELATIGLQEHRIQNNISSIKAMLGEINLIGIENKILDIEDEIGTISGELGSIKTQLTNLSEYKKELVIIKNNINLIKKQSRKYLIWKDAFPRIKRILINSFLPRFQDETNKYLKALEAGIEVLFDIDFARANNEFSISVLEGYKEWGFDERSRGMQSRIALGIGLALGDLARFDRTTTFEFRLFDEVIDSLDKTGTEEFFNMITGLPGQKFFITHDSSLKNMFQSNDVLTIVKEGGISCVEVS